MRYLTLALVATVVVEWSQMARWAVEHRPRAVEAAPAVEPVAPPPALVASASVP